MLSLQERNPIAKFIEKKLLTVNRKYIYLNKQSHSATQTRRLDDLKLLMLLPMSRGVQISCSTSPIWQNPSSGLSGYLQIDPWAAAFWKLLGQLLFSLSLYPALPLLSALARLHLYIEPNIRPDLVQYMLWKYCYLVLDFSERIVRF